MWSRALCLEGGRSIHLSYGRIPAIHRILLPFQYQFELNFREIWEADA